MASLFHGYKYFLRNCTSGTAISANPTVWFVEVTTPERLTTGLEAQYSAKGEPAAAGSSACPTEKHRMRSSGTTWSSEVALCASIVS